MPVKFSQDQLLMHAVWRKALREGLVELTLSDDSTAKKVRFALYNSVKAVRDGRIADEELAQAVRECSVSLQGLTVTVQTRTSTKMMSEVAGALGLDVTVPLEAPKDAEQVEIEQSMAKLLEKMSEAPEAGQRVTPYYTR